ncbi:MAG: glycine--tRNA ligase subunit beta [Candidatus Omnitrophica bacterium]|nr:glycine--tRNA ligase subunit beta [Candidatus Omnitrophota bacterium]
MEKSNNSKNFLLEIGTEELPVDALDVLRGHFTARLEAALKEARLAFGSTKLELTPRRVVFFIDGLSLCQEDEALEVTGPPKDKAYDSSGKPTEALLGFLRAKQLKEKDIFIRESRGTKCVAAKIVRGGKPAEEILPEIILRVLQSLPFPKLMRWDNSGFRFPRPVRWCLAILGNKSLALSLGGVKAKSETHGHRFLSNKTMSVKGANWEKFKTILRKNHVVLDCEERKALIRKGLTQKEKSSPPDEGLIHVASLLVEEPFLIEGTFKKEYLKLPEEILYTAMKKYQRIFAVYDSNGKVLDRFIAVINGKRKDLARLKLDYERVLESRLADAQFFYHEDTRSSLDSKRDRLKDLVFMKKLGTFLEKEERLVRLAEYAVSHRESSLGLNEAEKDYLRRAARLSKNDLTTQMVFEFPELQGVMGREYACYDKEPLEVARAISEHYLPKSLTEDYRHLAKSISRAGAVLGVIDRLDTLVGTFAIGLEPTGSQDPFALRRAGGTLVKLIRAFNLRFPYISWTNKLLELYGIKGDAEVILFSKKRGTTLSDFIEDRISAELQVKAGTREYEILQGVTKYKGVGERKHSDIANVFYRYEILCEMFRNRKVIFERAFKVVERTKNIIRGSSFENYADILKPPDPNLFSTSEEKKLYELLTEVKPKLKALIKDERYEEVVKLYGDTFYEPIHVFFDKVLVNVEDKAVKNNRLNLMANISDLFVNDVADLSEMTNMDVKT